MGVLMTIWRQGTTMLPFYQTVRFRRQGVWVSACLHDDLAVGHHHADPPEQGLQVLRQLHAPRVPGVHGDEQPHAGVQAHLAAVREDERLLPLADGAQDAVHLWQGERRFSAS